MQPGRRRLVIWLDDKRVLARQFARRQFGEQLIDGLSAEQLERFLTARGYLVGRELKGSGKDPPGGA